MHKKQDQVVQLRQKANKSMEECIMIDKLNEDIKYLNGLVHNLI